MWAKLLKSKQPTALEKLNWDRPRILEHIVAHWRTRDGGQCLLINQKLQTERILLYKSKALTLQDCMTKMHRSTSSSGGNDDEKCRCKCEARQLTHGKYSTVIMHLICSLIQSRPLLFIQWQLTTRSRLAYSHIVHDPPRRTWYIDMRILTCFNSLHRESSQRR